MSVSYQVTIEGRPLPVSGDLSAMGELIETDILAQWYDNDASQTGMLIYRKSDTVRFTDTVLDWSYTELIESVLKNYPVSGTRTSGTRFTALGSYWTASAEIGFWGYFYASTAPYSGTWLRIIANTTTYLDINGTIPTGANRVAICDRDGMRFSTTIGAKEGFYGVHFSTKIVKTIPSDGSFRYFGLVHKIVVRENWTNEVFVPGGTVNNGWAG